jgi:hypothetical protein
LRPQNSRKPSPANVRFGSKADMGAWLIDVRFTPESRHRRSALECPLCAKSGHMHCNKKLLARLRLLCFRPHEPATLQALSRLDRVDIVDFRTDAYRLS